MAAQSSRLAHTTYPLCVGERSIVTSLSHHTRPLGVHSRISPVGKQSHHLAGPLAISPTEQTMMG